MIRKAVERVYEIVAANFNADFQTLAGAASVPGVAAEFYKRLAAEVFSQRTNVGIGVYQDGGATQGHHMGAAPGAGVRDSRVQIVVDWFIRGESHDEAALQTEVAIDAVLRSVDRLVDDAQLRGVATSRESFVWTIERTGLFDDASIPYERALMRFPAWVRDTSL